MDGWMDGWIDLNIYVYIHREREREEREGDLSIDLSIYQSITYKYRQTHPHPHPHTHAHTQTHTPAVVFSARFGCGRVTQHQPAHCTTAGTGLFVCGGTTRCGTLVLTGYSQGTKVTRGVLRDTGVYQEGATAYQGVPWFVCGFCHTMRCTVYG